MALQNIVSTETGTYTSKGTVDQNSMVEQYLPVVRRHALSLQVRLPASIELNDLIQAGVVGLMESLSRFDQSKGASFPTFASRRIRGAMIDELRTRDWMPRSVRRKAREIDECIRLLEQRLGRPPTEKEIAQSLDMSDVEYQRTLTDTNNGQLLQLDEMIDDAWEPESDSTSMATPFDALMEGEQREVLVEAINKLPTREKTLMALYYQEEMNLKEIGAIMGVTESRVCQLHSQAISRLRSKLRH